MQKRLGARSITFANPPKIIGYASMGGPREEKGPLGKYFDATIPESLYGESSWEKAESKMLADTIRMSVGKANLNMNEVDFILAGDLLNQIVACNFAARDFPVSFLGLYGACSSMVEAMILGSTLIDGGFGGRAVAAACSHHETAERQLRFPTELGVQRPQTAQWTVTGAGAVLLSAEGQGPRITYGTIGRVVDYGLKNPYDMGSAMAPAAADTLLAHFNEVGCGPRDYDLILTGDLGCYGIQFLREELSAQGHDCSRIHDCGLLIYDQSQDVHAGGSGCGCSASVLTTYLLPSLIQGKFRRVLLAATGALLSPLTYQQGESIPSICHAVTIEAG